ncbi:unnamed protein product [Rhodiola kirilowii]
MGTVKIKTSRRIGIGVAQIVEIEVIVVEGFVVPVEVGKSRLKSRPVLMAPKFGFDDGCSSNFDATLLLATMLQSQLHGGHTSEPSPGARVHSGQGNVSDHPSDHTKIWSELSGSAAKNGSGTQGGQVQDEANVNANPRKEVQGISAMHISKPDASNRRPVHHMDTDIPRTRD